MKSNNKIFYVLATMIAIGLSTVDSHAQNANCKVRDQDIAAIYKGGCKDGLANGQGLAKGRDTYEGEFKDGDKVKGTYTWGPSACKTKVCTLKHVGEFKDDEFDGYGEREWSNGDSYKGQWAKGKMVGLSEFAKKEKAETCNKKQSDYVNAKCGAMTTYNYQCHFAKKETYASLCSGKSK